MKCRNVKGNLIIETRHYTVVLSSARGGSILYLFRLESSENKREGCEIRDMTGSWSESHYEQEYGGVGKFKVEISPSTIKVEVKSNMGSPKKPRRIYGWCENNWIFRDDTPLISCNFKIGQPKQTRSHFKKYICVKPNFYTHWAYKKDGEISSSSINKQHPAQAPIRDIIPEWITFFNQNEGLALLPPNPELWRGETYWFNIWCTKTMDELLYACVFNKKEINLTMNYLMYPTTPEEKYHILEEMM